MTLRLKRNLPRVYIETTVWSFAFANDSPVMTEATLEFFEACRRSEFAPVISALVLREIADSPAPKRRLLQGLVEEISPELAALTPTAERLTAQFLELGAVPPGKPEDAGHVAAAFTARCPLLVSWNFKHINNIRRAERFNAIAALAGFDRLTILTPGQLIDEESTEDTP